MRSQVWASALVLVLALFLASCEEDQNSAAQGEAKIGGTVIDNSTLAPVPGVSVRANSVALGSQTTTTDAQGVYEFTFSVDSTATVELVFTKSGYNEKTETATVQSAQFITLNVEVVARSPIIGGGGGEGGSGLAQTIAFLGADPQEVSVYGVGGQETSILGFEARDSLGLPIDASASIDISFMIIGGLNGAEYISPSTVSTNATGQAYTTFNAGIRSGVVQVVASATVGTRVIQTAPIRVVIHAGFPDQTHFTVGPVLHNFPTLNFAFGLRDAISVLVGDKYSNPVEPNTALYMRSSAGVIQASVFTDDDGEGVADLISGNPYPLGSAADPSWGDGYHYVVANTIGQNGEIVIDSTLMLWSAVTEIKNISPTSFAILNGGSQSFSFEVSDYLGHPLAAGTKITVLAQIPPPPCPDCPVNPVLTAFGIQGTVELDDFILPGSGTTQFGFVVSDGDVSEPPLPTAVTITISVDSPNGDAYFSFVGSVE